MKFHLQGVVSDEVVGLGKSDFRVITKRINKHIQGGSGEDMINEKQEELVHGIFPTVLFKIFTEFLHLLFSREAKTSCKHEEQEPIKRIREKLL